MGIICAAPVPDVALLVMMSNVSDVTCALQELMAGAGWRPGAPGHDGLLPAAPLQQQLSIPYLMQHARLCAQGLSTGARTLGTEGGVEKFVVVLDLQAYCHYERRNYGCIHGPVWYQQLLGQQRCL